MRAQDPPVQRRDWRTVFWFSIENYQVLCGSVLNTSPTVCSIMTVGFVWTAQLNFGFSTRKWVEDHVCWTFCIIVLVQTSESLWSGGYLLLATTTVAASDETPFKIAKLNVKPFYWRPSCLACRPPPLLMRNMKLFPLSRCKVEAAFFFFHYMRFLN